MRWNKPTTYLVLFVAEVSHYYSVVLASASDLRKIETALCNKYGVTGISNAVDRVEKTLAALLREGAEREGE